MKTASIAAIAALATSSAAADATVGVGDSASPWLGFMNVFELPENGGGFVFGSGWGIADLVSSFDDGAESLTMFPNQIGDANEFWYQGGRPGEDPMDPNDNGGPGAPGNKIMEANIYQEVTDTYAGMNVTFEGTLLADTFTDAHEVRVFIRDFASDYMSSVDNFVLLTTPGDFSISLATDAGAGRHVQWGIQVKGVNVWSTDIAPFGSATFATIPAPASAALLGLGGLVAARRRR